MGLSVGCSIDLEALSGLRNLLVHRYWIVKDDMVYESIEGDF
ncbi:MAG: HepT-like ribonuclease domain-containing protein [Vulcanisaeta sp.]